MKKGGRGGGLFFKLFLIRPKKNKKIKRKRKGKKKRKKKNPSSNLTSYHQNSKTLKVFLKKKRTKVKNFLLNYARVVVTAVEKDKQSR